MRVRRSQRKPRELWKFRMQKLDMNAREEICSRYQQGESLNELAKAFAVGYRTVRHHIVNAGIPLRPKGGAHH